MEIDIKSFFMRLLKIGNNSMIKMSDKIT